MELLFIWVVRLLVTTAFCFSPLLAAHNLNRMLDQDEMADFILWAVFLALSVVGTICLWFVVLAHVEAITSFTAVVR